MNTALVGTFGSVIGLFLILLAILWFFLPFAIFGIKDKLDTIIKHQESLLSLGNKALKEMTPEKIKVVYKGD